MGGGRWGFFRWCCESKRFSISKSGERGSRGAGSRGVRMSVFPTNRLLIVEHLVADERTNHLTGLGDGLRYRSSFDFYTSRIATDFWFICGFRAALAHEKESQPAINLLKAMMLASTSPYYLRSPVHQHSSIISHGSRRRNPRRASR